MTSSKYLELKQSCEDFNHFLSYIAETSSDVRTNPFNESRSEHQGPDNPIKTEMINYMWSQRHRIAEKPPCRYDLMEIYCSSDSQLTNLRSHTFGFESSSVWVESR